MKTLILITAISTLNICMWAGYSFSDEKIDMIWRYAQAWKWISGTFMAVSAGRMIYLFAADAVRYNLTELIFAFMLFSAWILTFVRCMLAEFRLYEANREAFQIIAGECLCGGKIECHQKVEDSDTNEDDIIVYYRIYCPKCKMQTDWHQYLDSACEEWQRLHISENRP